MLVDVVFLIYLSLLFKFSREFLISTYPGFLKVDKMKNTRFKTNMELIIKKIFVEPSSK